MANTRGASLDTTTSGFYEQSSTTHKKTCDIAKPWLNQKFNLIPNSKRFQPRSMLSTLSYRMEKTRSPVGRCLQETWCLMHRKPLRLYTPRQSLGVPFKFGNDTMSRCGIAKASQTYRGLVSIRVQYTKHMILSTSKLLSSVLERVLYTP